MKTNRGRTTIRSARLVSSILVGLAATLLGVGPAEAGHGVVNITGPADDGGEFNGAGAVISCGGALGSVGIHLAGVNGAHVHSYEVTGCEIGVLVTGGGTNHLNDLYVHDNVFLGTLSGSGDGIQLVGTSGNHLNGIRSISNDAFGVRLEQSRENTFNTMEVTENIGPPHCGGYFLVSSNNNRITSNDISRNGDVGVQIQDSTGNAVHSSIVDNTNFFGTPTTAIVVIGNSDGNSIHSNQTSGNQNGISLGCPTGCTFVASGTSGADGNIVLSSTSSGNFGDGIQVGGVNTGNRLQGNTALTNGGVDLRDDNPGCDTNVWKSNTFATDSEGDGPGAGCIK